MAGGGLALAEEVTFSPNLVPVEFKTGQAEVLTQQDFQGAVTYAFYVMDGKTLELPITQEALKPGANTASYELKDAQGNSVATGEVLETGPTTLKLTVPGAGLYYFEYNDFDAGWQTNFSDTAPCALILEKDKHYVHHGILRKKYFYVPRGTENIQLFVKGAGSGPVKICDGAGTVVKEAACNDGVDLTVPVSPGTDGTLWSVGGDAFTIGDLWFANVPNVLSASPYMALVPKEVAEKDGLMIAAP
ncbi:hypothetical protein BH09VER1_BH09VER1_51740 [soil metagenome]